MFAFLTITHVSKSYGFQSILNDVSLVVNAGERIGLVGANGVGKSTLLKIIMGEIVADSGEVALAPERKLGYLAQVIEGFDDQTLEALIAASVAHLRTLEARMRSVRYPASSSPRTRALMRISPPAAAALRRAARLVTLPITA